MRIQMQAIYFLLICLLLQVQLIFCQYKNYRARNPPIRAMTKNDGGILLADTSRIISLSNSLLTTSETDVSNKPSIVGMHTYDSFLTTFDEFGNVNIYNRETFQHLINHSSLLNPPLTEPSNLIGSHSSVDSIQFYIGQSVPIGTETQEDRMSEFDLFQFSQNFQSLSGDPIRFRELSRVNREYLYVFEMNGFVYFVVNQQNDLSTVKEVRIVRICANDTFYNTDFSTKYEISISCLPNENQALFATHAHTHNNKLIITFSTGEISSLCVFEVSKIDQLMNEKYVRCVNGENGEKAGFIRNRQAECRKLDRVGSVCNLGGYLRSGLEVSETLTMDSIYSKNNDTWIRGVTSFEKNGLDFVFLGIANGEVFKMILSENSIEIVHTYRIYPDIPRKLELDSTNSEINVQTDALIYKLPFESCDTLKGCNNCLSTQDPACGWCTLLKSCTQETECYRESIMLPWMSSVDNQSICVSLQILDNLDTISVNSNVPNLTVSASDLPSRQNGFICDFGVLGTSTLMPLQSDTYRCPLPSDYRTQVLSSSIEIYLSLRDVDTDLVFVTANKPIRFYDCSKFDRCTSCTNIEDSAFSCSWCIHSTTCTDTSEQCDSDTRVESDGSCPTLFNVTVPQLIHVLVPSGVMIRGEQLPEPKLSSSGYQCYIAERVYEASYINQSMVVCNNITLPVHPTSVMEYSRSIRVVWNNHYTIETVGTIQVTSYDCGYLANECSACQAIQFSPQYSDYKCNWCTPLNTCYFTPYCQSAYNFDATLDICPSARLESIEPNEGPNLGGTVVTIRGSNLGIQVSDILSVAIGGSTCDLNIELYQAGKVVVCRTRGNLIDTFEVKINLRNRNQPITGLFYTYSEPKVFEIEPKFGPVSGNTKVTVTGEKLLIGSETKVQIGTKDCDILETLSDNSKLVCITQGATSPGQTSVLLKIDDLMISVSQGSEIELLSFTYLPDPTVTKVIPSSMFPSGGVDLEIRGTDFHGIQSAFLYISSVNRTNRVRRSSNFEKRTTCEVINEHILSCPTPELTIGANTLDNAGLELSFALELDSVQDIHGVSSVIFMLYPDPKFSEFRANLTQSPDEPILIQGSNFLLNGLAANHFQISAGDRECTISHVQEQLVICYLDNREGSTEPLFVKARVGNIRKDIGYLQLTQITQLWILILPPVVIFLCVIFLISGIVSLVVFIRHSRKKDVKLYRMVKNLEELEMGVAQESKRGFTELQTCVDEFDHDIPGSKIPFLELSTFLMNILFPGGNNLLSKAGSPYRKNLFSPAMIQFNDLIMNEDFLIHFIAVMESQEDFGIKDKCNVASLIMVCLITEMDYATHILKVLLCQLIDKSVKQQNPKMLLRRTESIGEKLLTNWLAICLYGYIQDHIGTPLYRLFRALKMQLEKGPIDVVTGEARYSLSEEKLLRHVIEEEKLYCFLDTGEGNGIPITFLDWDSVSQAKQKVLDTLYKGRPVTERPSMCEVDLEHTRNRFGVTPLILRDFDASSECEKGWNRVNTLHHYKIESGAHFQLIPRKEPSKCDYTGSLIVTFDSNPDTSISGNIWHLNKPDHVDMSSHSLKDKMASEVYLHRLLYSKNVLQKFVNDLFESILEVNDEKEGFPLAIQYFFDMLEEQAIKNGIMDQDIIHTWKNNSLALRFWVNLIKNPEFIFSVHKSSTMDSCLLVVAQTFMDSFSVSHTKLNKDSPTSKLLYAKEVRTYKQKVANFYDDIKKLPKVSEDDMREEMNTLSQNLRKTDIFDQNRALLQLFQYARNYSHPLYQSLTENGHNSLAGHFQDVLQQKQFDDVKNNNLYSNSTPQVNNNNQYGKI